MPPKKQAPPPVEARIDGQSGTAASAVRKSVVEDFSTKLKRQTDELRAENYRLKEALGTIERETEIKVKNLTQENAQLSYYVQENYQIILGYEQQIYRLQSERTAGSNEMLYHAEQEKVGLLERIARFNSENDKSSERYLEIIQERDYLKGKCSALLQQLEEVEETVGRQRLEQEHLYESYDELQNKIILLEQYQNYRKPDFLLIGTTAGETMATDTWAEDTDQSQNEYLKGREVLQTHYSGDNRGKYINEQLNAVIDESKSTISKLRQNLERQQQQLHQHHVEIEQLNEMQMQAEDKYSAYQQTIDQLQAYLNKILEKSNAPSLLSENYSAIAEKNEPPVEDIVEGVTASALTPLLVQHALSYKYTVGLENVDYNKMRKEMQDLRDQLSRMDVLKQDYDVLHDEYLLYCEECAKLSADRKRMQQNFYAPIAPTVDFSAVSPTLLESKPIITRSPVDPRAQESSTQKSVFRSPSLPVAREREESLREQPEQQGDRDPKNVDLMLYLPDYEVYKSYVGEVDAETQTEEQYRSIKQVSEPGVDLDRFYILPKPKHFDKAQQCGEDRCGLTKSGATPYELLEDEFARCSVENAELKATIAKMQRMARAYQTQTHVPKMVAKTPSCALCRKIPADMQLCVACLRLYDEAVRMLPSVPTLCDPDANFVVATPLAGVAGGSATERTRAQLLEEQMQTLYNENAGLHRDFYRLRKAAKLVKAEYEKGCDIQRVLLQCFPSNAIKEAAELGDIQKLRELAQGGLAAPGSRQYRDAEFH